MDEQRLTQKDRTRAQIVAVASRMFSERGLSGTTIADVMSEVGRTHGCFYAHFDSKNALFADAVESAFVDLRAELAHAPRGIAGGAWLAWVGARVFDHRCEACLARLACEVSRAEGCIRDAFDAQLEGLVDEVGRRIGGSSGDGARRRVLRSVAMWTGAALLAAAIPEGALKADLLDACRPAATAS